MLPQLIDRWRLGTIPEAWDKAKAFLTDRLGNLERILSVLHGAVEHPRPSVDSRVSCTAVTAITSTTATDITGASVTIVPVVDMTAFIVASFDVQCSLFGAAGQFFVGTLVVNGSTQAQQTIWSGSSLNNRTMLTQLWTISMKSGTSYVLKLQAATTNVATNFNVNNIHTSFVVTRYPNVYKPT